MSSKQRQNKKSEIGTATTRSERGATEVPSFDFGVGERIARDIVQRQQIVDVPDYEAASSEGGESINRSIVPAITALKDTGTSLAADSVRGATEEPSEVVTSSCEDETTSTKQKPYAETGWAFADKHLGRLLPQCRMLIPLVLFMVLTSWMLIQDNAKQSLNTLGDRWQFLPKASMVAAFCCFGYPFIIWTYNDWPLWRRLTLSFAALLMTLLLAWLCFSTS
ncbi:MAG: hypothetical protein NTW96_19735 [Planctomycetia bacterium]|nr:hypothetical protein [Planctomycetia bacterium]